MINQTKSLRLSRNQLIAAICLALAVGTFLLYLPVRHNGFTNFDDDGYITGNAHVTAGLTWPGIVWAFKSGYGANWHPLTWISHMVDCQLFGVNPAGHHLMNVLFHTANTLLLFILLIGLTGAIWRSALVAALFAWHPMHVESVAWAAERKDVLSAFFWMLTLMAYAHYAKAPADRRHSQSIAAYLLALLLFACALMSKPMVVTLPFVLLLLDFWPLRRWGFPPHPNPLPQGGEGGFMSPMQTRFSPLPRLVIEKVPFFALALAGSVVTYLVQKQGGAVSADSLSFRLMNSLGGYVRYISKLFWPTDLSIFYPFPAHGMVLMAVVGAVLLGACSIAFTVLSGRWPYLFVGWFWFLGTLVPAIGIVEVGSACMADRYSYLPSIGLFIVVTWGAADFFEARRNKLVPAVAAIAVLAACAFLTHLQISYWRNSITLFGHALTVTEDNYVAFALVGEALDADGRDKEALPFCQRAVKINPNYPPADFYLGVVLWKEGDAAQGSNYLNAAVKIDPRNPVFEYKLGEFLADHGLPAQAAPQFEAAVRNKPDFAEAHNALGKVYLSQNKLPEAAEQLAQSSALEPDNAQFHYDLGTVLLAESKPTDAIAEFMEALRLKPDFASAEKNLAVALASQGKLDEAIVHFAKAVELQPDDADARFNLGFAYLNERQPAEAATQFLEELRLTPDETKARYRLAEALAEQNQLAQAVQEYRQALRLTPNFPEAHKELDEILAAHPQLR